MKLGKVFLLMLVLLLALFVCASCDDDESLNVASDQIVEDVVETTSCRLGETSAYVVGLIGFDVSPSTIETSLKGDYEGSFINTTNGDTITVTESSLVFTRTLEDAKYDVSITDLAESKKIAYEPVCPIGSFSVTRYEEEGVKAFTCSGTFKIDDTYYSAQDGNLDNLNHVDLTEVVFDSITYDGTKYDVKKFNEKALEDAPLYINIVGGEN